MNSKIQMWNYQKIAEYIHVFKCQAMHEHGQLFPPKFCPGIIMSVKIYHMGPSAEGGV